MPNIVNIPADAEPPRTLTVAEMEAEIKAAGELVEEIRLKRVEARELAPAEKRQILAETDAEFVTAIDRHNELQRILSRALGRGEQKIRVGAASEAGKAGSTKGDS